MNDRLPKLPAIQFYPGDWKRDPGVQALSLSARGGWFEILLLMHESEERGKLLLNGKPMPLPAIAANLRIPEAEAKQIIEQIETYGVASRDPETGALVNRKMLKDDGLRKTRAKAGRKGGKASGKARRSKNEAKRGSSSSSSSSSSTSSSKEGEEKIPPLPLSEVWRTRKDVDPIGQVKAQSFINAAIGKGATPDQIRRALAAPSAAGRPIWEALKGIGKSKPIPGQPAPVTGPPCKKCQGTGGEYVDDRRGGTAWSPCPECCKA